MTSSERFSDSRMYKWRTLVALAHVDGKACEAERKFVYDTLISRRLPPDQMKIIKQDFETARCPDDFFSKVTDLKDRAALFYLARLMFFKDDEFCDYEKMYYDKFKAEHMESLDMKSILAVVEKIETDMRDEFKGTDRGPTAWFKAGLQRLFF